MIKFLGSYSCKKLACQQDSSHTENIDWGYHNDTDGTKNACQTRCLNNPDCGAYEWSDTHDKARCMWWRTGACQHDDEKIIDDPKFVSCTKIGDHLPFILEFFTNELPDLVHTINNTLILFE